MFIYVYIYIYVYIFVYVYIYIYIQIMHLSTTHKYIKLLVANFHILNCSIRFTIQVLIQFMPLTFKVTYNARK